jgi:lipopolysaccharide/colanic/teichoic acid biosynthesis glycosyltransferase
MLKRCFDLLLAVIGLLLLLPLFPLIVLVIYMDSPGPIFFRQKRVGKNEKLFDILKFRTMEINAESKGKRLTATGDKRITWTGNILRRFKIDELPQLINILKGDMSFVGPRPEVPEYVAYYSAEIKDKILSIRPGITDWASLEFRDESTLLAGGDDPEKMYIETILPRKLQLGCDYVNQSSLLLDIKIICETAVAIVFGADR